MVIWETMTVARRCLSLSIELDSALLTLSLERSQSISSVVEMLLREHPLVREGIEIDRMERHMPSVMAASGRRLRKKATFRAAPPRAAP
jgi:hypothetical protein